MKMANRKVTADPKMDNRSLAECGKTPLSRHSFESDSPKGIETTGFPL